MRTAALLSAALYCVAALVPARAAEADGEASFWIAKAADHFLTMERPIGEYPDVITALSLSGDKDRLRRVVTDWERRVADMVGEDEEPFWAHANAYLSAAEGWARAGDGARFAQSLARADGIAEGILDETKAWYTAQKPQAVAYHDPERAIELVAALPEKRRPEKLIEVAWACAEMRNVDGMRRALAEANAAAARSLDDNGKARIAAGEARVLITAGDLAGAAEAASRLRTGWRINVYERLVRVHHVEGRAASADAVLKQMADLVGEAEPSQKVQTAAVFAGSAAAVGRGAAALSIVRLAEQDATPPADAPARAEWVAQLANAYACVGAGDASRQLLDGLLELRTELRAARVADTLKRRAEEGEVPEGDPLDLRDESGLPLRLTLGRAFDDTLLSHITFALARAGRLDDALWLGAQVDPREKENAAMWTARGAAAAGDVAAAGRIADGITGKVAVVSVARWVAEELGRRRAVKEIHAWAASRPTDEAKLAAYLGAAEGMTARLFWEARLGL